MKKPWRRGDDPPRPLRCKKSLHGCKALVCNMAMNEQVCFCFGYSVADIEADLAANGRSTILERIAAEKSLGACHCAQKNPKGR